MYFWGSNFWTRNEKTANPAKTCVQKNFTFTKKLLHTQNCCCSFIKNLLTEKCKENMSFKSQFNKKWN